MREKGSLELKDRRPLRRRKEKVVRRARRIRGKSGRAELARIGSLKPGVLDGQKDKTLRLRHKEYTLLPVVSFIAPMGFSMGVK